MKFEAKIHEHTDMFTRVTIVADGRHVCEQLLVAAVYAQALCDHINRREVKAIEYGKGCWVVLDAISFFAAYENRYTFWERGDGARDSRQEVDPEFAPAFRAAILEYFGVELPELGT